MKQVWMALSLLCSGLLLMAAAMEPASTPGNALTTDPGLPGTYWDSPRATTAVSPHDWSKLETNLHPEACAQCHRPQFDAWKNSLHAHAYSSGLVGQFPDMGHEGANNCLQCHAPLDEQLYR
ncbi:MAG: multiheme c-type cytochrome, partial [Mariprofundaceae bacterium]